MTNLITTIFCGQQVTSLSYKIEVKIEEAFCSF